VPLERLALIFIAIAAAIWIGVMFLGLVAALPWGLPGLVVFGAVGYLFWRVLRERLSSAEDDYYEKNIKQ